MIRHFVLPLAALAVLVTPAAAQRRQPTPEQRIERLEKQVRQVQGRVFPKGQPADTAGVSDDPAATQSSVSALVERLDAIERQMADLVRTSEEQGNRLATLEAELARTRADQERRLRALETAAQPAADAAAEPADEAVSEPAVERVGDAPPPRPRPKVEAPATPAVASTGDPAELAYDAGFQLWNKGRYDQAIAALRAMAEKYPNHRRTSWAHNLIGRALLDKGQPRAAAEALLANYRRDPSGERAQDSLYYLGQSLMKLNQAGQACKAYAELEEKYAGKVRPQLVALLPAAKREARC